MLVANISGILFVVLIVLRLRYLNAWNEKRRVEAGKRGFVLNFSLSSTDPPVLTAAKIIDYSMLTSEELRRLSIEPRDESVLNAEDLTDLQNNEFIVGLFYMRPVP